MLVKILLSLLVAGLSFAGFFLSIYLVGWQTLGGRAYEFIQWITVAIGIIILIISIIMIWQGDSWYGINFSLLIFPLTYIIAQICIYFIKRLE